MWRLRERISGVACRIWLFLFRLFPARRGKGIERGEREKEGGRKKGCSPGVAMNCGRKIVSGKCYEALTPFLLSRCAIGISCTYDNRLRQDMRIVLQRIPIP
jgi:hypothetical protein